MGDYIGTTIGLIKGGCRTLDYSSFGIASGFQWEHVGVIGKIWGDIGVI